MKITHVSLTVGDQDQAVQWFSDMLGFRKVQDAPFRPGARWVTVSPPDQAIEIILEHESMADGEAMAAEFRERVGKSGTIALEVPDVRALSADLKAKGVTFEMEPNEYPWGIQAIIADPYGNKFMINQTPPNGSAQ